MTVKGTKQGPSPKRGARHAAQQAGEKYYMVDTPCKRGHVELRITATGICVECHRVRELERYWGDPGKSRQKAKTKASRNREKLAELAALERATEPPEKRKVRLEKAKLKAREWRRKNPQHRTALTTAHKQRVKQRTPAWADMKKITEIYKNCPKGHHVDHEIPLQGKFVSGLHVPENLQYLPAAMNISKSNKFVPA